MEVFAPAVIDFLKRLSLQKRTMLAGIFASPYMMLRSMPWLQHNVIFAYEDDTDAMQSFLSVMNGKIGCQGKNPVPHAVKKLPKTMDKKAV